MTSIAFSNVFHSVMSALSRKQNEFDFEISANCSLSTLFIVKIKNESAYESRYIPPLFCIILQFYNNILYNISLLEQIRHRFYLLDLIDLII